MSVDQFFDDNQAGPDQPASAGPHRSGPSGRSKRLVGAFAAVVLVAAAVWGGYTWLNRDQGQARKAADRVAAGLAKGAFEPGSVSAAKGAAGLDTVLGGIPKGTKRTVTVSSITEPNDGKATAKLAHEWTLPGAAAPWKYETSLEVRDDHGTWKGVWTPAIVAPELREGQKLRVRRLQADRAQILGAGKKPIVQLRPVQDIGINKANTSAEQAVSSAATLAKAVGVGEANFVKAVRAAGPKAYVSAIIARVGSPQEKAALALDAPGVYLIPKELPLAPTPTFARPLLGSVGGATAEVIEKSKGRVAAGDEVGLSGVQAAYDTQLAGKPGYAVSSLGWSAADVRQLFRVDPEPGTPLTTTLDLAMQTAAEGTLAKVGPASAVVAIRPSTGAVLAAASGPGSKGVSTATQGRYAPGSTFKTVSSLALLRSGVTPSSKVECTPTITVDGRSFKNVDSYPESALGSVPFSRAFANSCNTAFIRAGEKLEPGDLPDAAGGLGLTAKAALGVPAFLGSVPAPKPGTDEAASMIGQSKVEASPLGMATVAASIAAGKPVTPTLVTGVAPGAGSGSAAGSPSGSPEASGSSKASPSASPAESASGRGASGKGASGRPVTAAEAGTIKELMRAVVTDGSADFLDDVPGAPVQAKTGTAEFGSEGALKEHAWMIAIQGDLAVAVFVAEGEGGAATAGPLLKNFLTQVN